MKTLLVFFVASMTSAAAFANTYYTVNCSALKSSPEMADVFAGLQAEPADEPEMAGAQFMAAIQAMSTASVYYANVNKEVIVVAQKETFDASSDPDKGYTFGFACAFAWLAEESMGLDGILTVIDQNFKLPEGSVLEAYEATN